jgi:hypothetical protein
MIYLTTAEVNIVFFFLSVTAPRCFQPFPLIAAMANPLRQRLGALLSRPLSSPVQTAAGTKRFFASKSHAHDDAGEFLDSWHYSSLHL